MQFVVHLLAPTGAQRALVLSSALLYAQHVKSALAAEHSVEMPTSLRWRRFVRAVTDKYDKPRRVCHGLRAAHIRSAAPMLASIQTALAANLWACVVTGWIVLARPAELIALTRAALSFSSEGGTLIATLMIVPKKKRNKTPVPVPIVASDGGPTDVCAALARLEQLDPVPVERRDTTALFRIGEARLTNANITAAVRAVARAAGQPGVGFSGKSLRVGGATDLAARGAEEHTLRHMGRWDSDAYQAYARVSRGRALRQGALLAQDAPDDPSLEAIFRGYSQAARA